MNEKASDVRLIVWMDNDPYCAPGQFSYVLREGVVLKFVEVSPRGVILER